MDAKRQLRQAIAEMMTQSSLEAEVLDVFNTLLSECDSMRTPNIAFVQVLIKGYATFTVSVAQTHNKNTTKTQQTRNKHTTKTQQKHNKHTT